MSLRRIAQAAVVLVCTVICVACGQVYRPVVIPCTGQAGVLPGCPTINNPNPGNFHAAFAISSNSSFNPNSGGSTQNIWSYFPGTAMQIDVAGDADIGATNAGLNVTHATILSNDSRVYVANADSAIPGQADNISSFTPAFNSATSSGLAAGPVISLPSGSLPVFLNSTQINAVYVANFGTNSVSVINTSLNQVSIPYPVGVNPTVQASNPVSLAVTPDGTKLYVADQGDNSITSINTVGMSTAAVLPNVGSLPIWVLARNDNQRVYVLTQGAGGVSGTLIPIDPVTDTILNSQTNLSVGVGANFVRYDAKLNRLYVTNPNTSTLYIFSATGGIDPSTGLGNDTPTLLTTIPLYAAGTAQPTGNYPLCASPCPVSVAALPDGSRVYVASYQLSSTCTEDDPTNTAACQVIPQVTMIDALSYATTPIVPLPPTTSGATPSVTESGACIPHLPFTPNPVTLANSPVPSIQSVRFRLSTTAAVDSSRVYVGMCDAGSIAIIDTNTSSVSTSGTSTDDTLVLDLAAPFGVCTNTAVCTGQPPLQNPLFMFSGQ